ncbi:peptidoglycan recognition protein family protein [Mycobacterium sp. SMC-4]|nr:peptidoglycan recognition protein family protein [Mycobacterium sp. SMC-4]
MSGFEGFSDDARSFSRRRALWLAGAAGLGVVASACSTGDSGGPPADSATAVAQPIDPAPIPEVVVEPAPVVAAAPATLLCRDSWGAAAPRSGGRPHTVNRLTLHHTAVTLGDNSNAPARLRQHQAFHQNQHGWIDIAYHVSVDREGNIYELRSYDLAGDTATEYDPAGHFLVLCEGNFDEELVSDAQLEGAAKAFAWAAQHFGVSTETLKGHRDVAPGTACPGEDLYSYLTSGILKGKVDALIAAGGVDLQTICGPGADEAVAAIEAGVQLPPG